MYTEWFTARAARPHLYPCFTRLFGGYRRGLIRRDIAELVHSVAHGRPLSERTLTSVDTRRHCEPPSIVENRRFGKRLPRFTHGMLFAAGCLGTCLSSRGGASIARTSRDFLTSRELIWMELPLARISRFEWCWVPRSWWVLPGEPCQPSAVAIRVVPGATPKRS